VSPAGSSVTTVHAPLEPLGAVVVGVEELPALAGPAVGGGVLPDPASGSPDAVVVGGGDIERIDGPDVDDVFVGWPAVGAVGRALEVGDPPVATVDGRVDGVVAVLEDGPDAVVAVVPVIPFVPVAAAAASVVACPVGFRRWLKLPPARIPPDGAPALTEPAGAAPAGAVRAAGLASEAPSVREKSATTPMARSMATRNATSRMSCCRKGPTGSPRDPQRVGSTSPGSLRGRPFLPCLVGGRILL
jgi:hypothetical protein